MSSERKKDWIDYEVEKERATGKWSEEHLTDLESGLRRLQNRRTQGFVRREMGLPAKPEGGCEESTVENEVRLKMGLPPRRVE